MASVVHDPVIQPRMMLMQIECTNAYRDGRVIELTFQETQHAPAMTVTVDLSSPEHIWRCASRIAEEFEHVLGHRLMATREALNKPWTPR